MPFFYIWAKVILKDITVTLIDQGNKHLLKAPLDMNMNLMELCKSHGFEVQGICGGMAMCASCQIYIHSNYQLVKLLRMSWQCCQRRLTLKKHQDWVVKFQ